MRVRELTEQAEETRGEGERVTFYRPRNSRKCLLLLRTCPNTDNISVLAVCRLCSVASVLLKCQHAKARIFAASS